MRSILALCVLALSACGSPIPGSADRTLYSVDADPVAGLGQLTGSGGRITGDIGPAVGVDADGFVDVFDDGLYMRVITAVDLGESAVMTRLSSTFPAMFVPGLDATFEIGNDEGVALVGCVGATVGVYDVFDAPADDLHIVIDDDFNVTVDAVLRDSDTVTRTTFTLDR